MEKNSVVARFVSSLYTKVNLSTLVLGRTLILAGTNWKL